GNILSYTVIRVPPHQFVDQAPYAVGIVELEDRVKLTGQIVDCDFEDIKIGKKVKIEFRKIFQEGKSGILCYGYKFVLE
ncbi:MAG: Zn-ribbon domain-containing OB-fold protein, partial [Candidatus Aminicenantaceae bacterium]